MDWIPKPAHVANPLPPVPCLNADDNGYDHHPDWNGYPARQGYTPRSWQAWVVFFLDPPPDLIAFLERWFFWGQLERVFDNGPLHLRPGDYVSSKRNIRIRKLLKILPTKALKCDHDSWGLNLAFQTPLDITRILRPAHTYPELPFPDFDPEKKEICMRTFCIRFARKYHDPRPAPLRWASTLISELAVTDILRTSHGGGEDFYRDHIITYAVAEHRAPQMVVLERLFSCGWCPWEVRMLSERFNTITCFYISQMQRPNPEMTHEMLRPALSNGVYVPRRVRTWECSPNMCQLKKIDQNSYNTAHTDLCMGCDLVAVDAVQMSGILLNGRIPVVPIDQLASRTDVVELVQHCDDNETALPYVAFSHVWSDGLGNLQGNSLPRCQLERLRVLVETYNSHKDAKSPTCHFWLDTLCVPPDSAAATGAAVTNLQQLATHKMKDTYEQATVVIVLDQWLVEASTRRMKASEIVMRIVCSPWTRRLWTLQEGLLARWHGLFVVLGQNQLHNVDDIWERLKHVNVHWPWRLHPILRQAFGRYQDLRGRQLPAIPWQRTSDTEFWLSLVLGSMQYRSTSVASDEALCLSVILGADTIAIAQAPTAERMETLWSMVHEVPLTLLFSDYPRVATHGLHWAPATLLHPQSTFGMGYRMAYYQGCTGTVRKEGLCTQRPGFMFHYEHPEDFTKNVDNIWVRFDSGELYNISSYTLSVAISYDHMMTSDGAVDVCLKMNRRGKEARRCWGPHFAVIWLPEEHMKWLHHVDEVHGLMVAMQGVLNKGVPNQEVFVVHLIEGVSVATEYRQDGLLRPFVGDRRLRRERAEDVIEYGDKQLWLIK